jgi:2-polyprenyl-3-methyl-5-hydroxy-6-metoxy-1,4-benzoquinol methylase
MSDEHLARWNARHAVAEGPGGTAEVLLRNVHLVPAGAKVLDLACGRGGNALWLAEYGLEVHAWDFSPVAIRRLAAAAAERGLTISAQVRDVIERPPAPTSFDMIVATFFLERALMPALAAALRPRGRLFYQTFTREGIPGIGPDNAAYRLAPNELLSAFPGLRLRYYREDGSAPHARAYGGEALPGQALLVAERVA